MCLTGYDDDVEAPKIEKMQVLNAEELSDHTMKELTELARKYDIYSFPELVRYYAAKGARLVINPTA